MENRLTRRQTAVRIGLSCAALAGGVGGPLLYGRSLRQLEQTASFEDFLDLCRTLLQRDELDRTTGEKIYDTILSEPFVRNHIVALKLALDRGTALAALSRDERWFAGHIVTTWYTGVYFYEGRSEQRMTFAKALMYDALRPHVPLPFMENTGYGAWAAPPAR
jgi:hypothetical protein